MTPERREALAKMLSRHIPLLDGSQWAPGFLPQWPTDFAKAERYRAYAAADAVIEFIEGQTT